MGTLPQFDKSSLLRYFRGLFITKAKDTISSYLIHKEISALEINAYLDELSAYMKERIEPVMAEYGITLVNFYVNDINIPEDDPAVRKLKAALAKRAEMDIIGYNYQQERSFDTLELSLTHIYRANTPGPHRPRGRVKPGPPGPLRVKVGGREGVLRASWGEPPLW